MTMESESGENKHEPSSEGGSSNGHVNIHWKCYVKGVSTTHVVIIFIPATYEDLILFNGEEHWWSEGSGDTSCIYANGKEETRRHSSVSFTQLSTNGQKYVLPTYVYDCHLSGLIEQLVQQSDTLHLGDILQVNYHFSMSCYMVVSLFQKLCTFSKSSIMLNFLWYCYKLN